MSQILVPCKSKGKTAEQKCVEWQSVKNVNKFPSAMELFRKGVAEREAERATERAYFAQSERSSIPQVVLGGNEILLCSEINAAKQLQRNNCGERDSKIVSADEIFIEGLKLLAEGHSFYAINKRLGIRTEKMQRWIARRAKEKKIEMEAEKRCAAKKAMISGGALWRDFKFGDEEARKKEGEDNYINYLFSVGY